MARPNLKFKNAEDPYKIRCGERRILTMQVKPRAVGTCKLTLFLKAATCVFAGGHKEITVDFEVTDVAEKRDLDIQLVMTGSRKITYSLNLNAKIKNAEGDKNDDFLLVKLDCRNPMSEEEQTVTFEEVPLTEVITPISETEITVTDTEEEDGEERPAIVIEEEIEVADEEADDNNEETDEEADSEDEETS